MIFVWLFLDCAETNLLVLEDCSRHRDQRPRGALTVSAWLWRWGGCTGGSLIASGRERVGNAELRCGNGLLEPCMRSFLYTDTRATATFVGFPVGGKGLSDLGHSVEQTRRWPTAS